MISFHIYMPINKFYPFCFEKCNLAVAASKCKRIRNFSFLIYDTVTRNFIRIRICMQRIPYDSRPPLISGNCSYLSIRRHLSIWNLLYYLIYFFKC